MKQRCGSVEDAHEIRLAVAAPFRSLSEMTRSRHLGSRRWQPDTAKAPSPELRSTLTSPVELAVASRPTVAGGAQSDGGAVLRVAPLELRQQGVCRRTTATRHRQRGLGASASASCAEAGNRRRNRPGTAPPRWRAAWPAPGSANNPSAPPAAVRRPPPGRAAPHPPAGRLFHEGELVARGRRRRFARNRSTRARSVRRASPVSPVARAASASRRGFVRSAPRAGRTPGLGGLRRKRA